MSSIDSGERGSPKQDFSRGTKRTIVRRSRRWAARSALLATLAASSIGVLAASAAATPITFGGNPLTVNVDELGQCQTSYLIGSEVAGNYYPGDSSTGDCGFFIATPSSGSGQPTDLQGSGAGRVFGFTGHAGPQVPTESQYEPVSNGPLTGSGSASDPYTLVTVYDVPDNQLNEAGTANNPILQITQTTTYVTGNPYFTANYDVKNISNLLPAGKDKDANTTVYYRAIYAGDLYVNGNDHGTGVYLAGPPRFVGGQNQTSGVLGGFQEDLQALDGSPTPAWTSFAEDYWDETEGGAGGIWRDVTQSANATNVFPDSVSPTDWDNGAGVSWDTNYTAGHGLAPGQDQKYAIVNLTTVPSGLQVSPTAQGIPQGGTATVTVTAVNNNNQPYANTPLRYAIAGVNPQSGVANTNASGVAQIKYVGANPGVDQISMYLDLGNSGAQAAADPTGSAQVTVVPAPPNSSVTVKSVKVNADGSITITYTPTEAGTGTLTVTVPTASVAKKAKAKKCKKGQVKIHGKCYAKTTVVGAASGKGTAGVPLTLTVKPSGKAKTALKKGHKLRVITTLSYLSAKGGAPSTHVYHETLTVKKGKKAKKGHKKH